MNSVASADRSGGAPVFDVDIYSDEFQEDPFVQYEKARKLGGVVWVPKYQVHLVVSYELVHHVLGKWQDFSSATGVGIVPNANYNPPKPNGLLLEMDPPQHTKYRSVMSAILSPSQIKVLRPQVDALAKKYVDAALAKGTIDAFRDLTVPFVSNVIGDLVGLPLEGRQHFLTMGEFVVAQTGPMNGARQLKTAQAIMETGAFTWFMSASKREALTPDGLGAKVYEAADRGEIELAEAQMLVGAFLAAGVDSTAYSLTNTLKNFTDNPEQWAKLVADTSLAKDAFEEALRLNMAGQLLCRSVTRPLTLGGVSLDQGSRLAIGYAASNRDPAKFQNPDRFDILRKPVGHHGFGFSLHACLGQILARAEAESLLTELANRVGRLVSAGTPVRKLNYGLTSWESLPLTLIPKGEA